jgi:hypothetical protein
MILLLSVRTSAESERTQYNELLTSLDPTRFSRFVIDGDTIIADAWYENDVVSHFSIPEPPSDTDFAKISVVLESGQSLNYRINYEVEIGWFFPAHSGLPYNNVRVIEEYEQARSEVVMQYLAGENANREEIEAVLDEIRRLTSEITSDYDADYDKARAISEWAAYNIYYDMLAAENDVSFETIALASVMQTKRTICSGFANLTAAMLEAVGLKAVTVIGHAKSIDEFDNLMTEPNRHEWTAFWYEDEARWVILDSGWDTWNRFTEDGFLHRPASPRKYFDITPLALAQTHRAERAERRDYFGVLSFFDAQENIHNNQNNEVEKKMSTESEEIVDNREEDTDSKADWFLIRIGIGGLAGIIIVVFILSKRTK